MRKKVLLTVTTYPLPSRSYDELVCTAGILDDGSWIRIYPVPLSFLKQLKVNGEIQDTKYTWIELELKQRTDDFRPESFSPKNYDFRDMKILGHIDTKNFWAERKKYCLKNVYTDFSALIEKSKAPTNVSLATFKPAQITDFIIKPVEREWKASWKAQFQQCQLNFENPNSKNVIKEPPPKVPYEFSYRFKEENGKEHTLMIEDWEIGQLYWHCLREKHDENLACLDVKEKYFNRFVKNNDIYLFLGTTRTNHIKRARNPFVIIGVFYPLKNPDTQLALWAD